MILGGVSLYDQIRKDLDLYPKRGKFPKESKNKETVNTESKKTKDSNDILKKYSWRNIDK